MLYKKVVSAADSSQSPGFCGASSISLEPDDRIHRKHKLSVLKSVVPWPSVEGILVPELRSKRNQFTETMRQPHSPARQCCCKVRALALYINKEVDRPQRDEVMLRYPYCRVVDHPNRRGLPRRRGAGN